MSGLRVVLDASPLLLRSAGVKNYVYYWVRNLAAAAEGRTFRLFPHLDGFGEFAHETSVLSWLPTHERLALLYAANLVPLPIADWFTPEADVFHTSHQLQRPPGKSRLTATIYDMTCWLMPEVHSAANVKASRRIADKVFRRADGLIAISGSTRADAIRLLDLAPEKVAVIYPGIAPDFFSARPSQEVAVRYGLAKPYALYVGSIEPRKNLVRLLEAWSALSDDLRDAFDLAVAGPWGWGESETYNRLRAGIPGVRYLGYVPERDLPALTAGAAVFVYVSLYEGFGLPVGQAMAAGVPAIVSNVSSLPEIAGDAALTVDPRSPSEICGALARTLESPVLRQELGARGRARARAFTWDDCARKSWAFFERVCG